MIYIFISLIIAIASIILYFDNKSKSFGIIEELRGNLSIETTEKLNLEAKYNKILDDLKKQEALKRSKELDEMQLLFTKVNMLDDKLTFLSTNVKNKMDLVLSLLENNIAKFEEIAKTPMVDSLENSHDEFEKFEQDIHNSSSDAVTSSNQAVEEIVEKSEYAANDVPHNSQEILDGADLPYTDVEKFEDPSTKPLTVDEFCSNNSNNGEPGDISPNKDLTVNEFCNNNFDSNAASEEISNSLVDKREQTIIAGDSVKVEEVSKVSEATAMEAEKLPEIVEDTIIGTSEKSEPVLDNNFEIEKELKPTAVTEDITYNDDSLLNDTSLPEFSDDSLYAPLQTEPDIVEPTSNIKANDNPFDTSHLKSIIGKMDEEIGVANSAKVEKTEDRVQSFEDASDFDISVLNTDTPNDDYGVNDDFGNINLDYKDINNDEELDVALKKLNDINVEIQNEIPHNNINEKSLANTTAGGNINTASTVSNIDTASLDVGGLQTDDIEQVVKVVGMYNTEEKHENSLKNNLVPEMDGTVNYSTNSSLSNNEEPVLEENSGFNIKESIDKLKAQLEDNK